MPFSVSVTVWEGDEQYTAESENSADLSLIKQNVNMRRSYKARTRKRKEVFTNYRFNAIVAREDGSKFAIKYMSPLVIEFAVLTDTPFTILAMAVYDKATDSVQITRGNLIFSFDVYADPCEDSAYTEQLTRVIACFRILHEITSVTFATKFRLETKVVLESEDPLHTAMLERDKNTKTIARCVKVAEKRLSDFDLLAKMKQ